MLDMFRIKTMELYYLYLHWIFQIAYHMLFFCEFQLIYIDYAKKIIIWLKKITLKTSPYKPLIQMKIGTKLCRYCVWKFLCKKKNPHFVTIWKQNMAAPVISNCNFK
jgi:hypothetical protein